MKKTQGQKLVALLKSKPMTSMQLQMTGISTCWWKRVAEALDEEWELKVVGKKRCYGARPINIYRVVRVSAPHTVWHPAMLPQWFNKV